MCYLQACYTPVHNADTPTHIFTLPVVDWTYYQALPTQHDIIMWHTIDIELIEGYSIMNEVTVWIEHYY